MVPPSNTVAVAVDSPRADVSSKLPATFATGFPPSTLASASASASASAGSPFRNVANKPVSRSKAVAT